MEKEKTEVTQDQRPNIRLTIVEVLNRLQNECKAPKSQYNSFGKYAYRNAEDIQQALKPLLNKYDSTITVTDEVKEIMGIPFIEATAKLIYNGHEIIVKAQAGIQLETKGMNYAQVFGSSSSYARKYALGGLLLLDDTKDADATNTHGDDQKQGPVSKVKAPIKPILKTELINCTDAQVEKAILQGNAEKLVAGIGTKFKVSDLQKQKLDKAILIKQESEKENDKSLVNDEIKPGLEPGKQVKIEIEERTEEKKVIGNKSLTVKG
jgi:hypothetical protein